MTDYKQKVDEWLASENKNIEAGAMLLLKLNRNRVLYDFIIRKKALDKLIYEMGKQSEILSKRQNFKEYKDLTEKEVSVLTDKSNQAEITLETSESKGKRADHDQLPEGVIKAYEDNQKIYPKMRSLHEKLKLMVNDRPCDRYPFLKELVSYDEKVRDNWKLYDNATITTGETNKPVVVTLDAKGVSAARKYLSDNKKKLTDLKSQDETKHQELLSKMQKRYDDLISSGQTLDEKQTGELKDLGINVKE